MKQGYGVLSLGEVGMQVTTGGNGELFSIEFQERFVCMTDGPNKTKTQ